MAKTDPCRLIRNQSSRRRQFLVPTNYGSTSLFSKGCTQISKAPRWCKSADDLHSFESQPAKYTTRPFSIIKRTRTSPQHAIYSVFFTLSSFPILSSPHVQVFPRNRLYKWHAPNKRHAKSREMGLLRTALPLPRPPWVRRGQKPNINVWITYTVPNLVPGSTVTPRLLLGKR